MRKNSGIDYRYLDTTARPGDDFARYATGHWIDYHPQPREYSSWGTIQNVYEENVKIIAEMIGDIAASTNKKGSVEQKIGDLYNLMMDTGRLNADGAKPLKALIAKVEALQSRDELLRYCATHHDNLLFSMFIAPDEKDSNSNIVCISQGGMTMGNRDYYLSDDPKIARERDLMRLHMKNLLVLAGYEENAAESMKDRIWAIETEMAKPSYSLEKQRIPEANYHKMSIADLKNICGDFPWENYLKDYRFDRTKEVDLGQPEPVAKACEILMTASLDDLKAIYIWDLIYSNSGILSEDFENENFEYAREMYGVQEKSPRWKKAQSLVSSLMADAVGQMYVERFFPENAKMQVVELVNNLKSALASRIMAQEWMTPATKMIALEKLDACGLKVGYPDKWDDLSGLVIDPARTLLENVEAAREFYWNLNYERKYEKPVDKSRWLMSAHTVNAYYDPSVNELCFPAGFLQAPLFDSSADAAANYGAIGVVIGHEMTHGFDDQGRLYTKDGNLCDWWTPEDSEAFKKPCDAMAEYFSSLWVIPGELKANGTLCLGENIADHGGLNIAFDAFQRWQKEHGRLSDDNGFTPEQRFFLSYANVWAEVTSPETLRYLTLNDVHSVNRLRINGALAQCDYWYDAFGIAEGDALYVNKENRIVIW